jgi:hypothetical protein
MLKTIWSGQLLGPALRGDRLIGWGLLLALGVAGAISFKLGAEAGTR